MQQDENNFSYDKLNLIILTLRRNTNATSNSICLYTSITKYLKLHKFHKKLKVS